MKGKLIVFEGGEGSGKTFQIKLLAKTLKKQNKKILITHEPGGTKISDKIRQVILHENKEKLANRAELFLFLASRAQHVEKKIIPYLKKGYYVLCDRFSGSTLAYQIGARKLANEILIKQMDEYARFGLNPDLVIYLDVDPKIGIARRKKDTDFKNLTSFDKQAIKFHKKVRSYFKKLAKQNKNWQTINANKTLHVNEQEIYEIINKKIR